MSLLPISLVKVNHVMTSDFNRMGTCDLPLGRAPKSHGQATQIVNGGVRILSRSLSDTALALGFQSINTRLNE